MAGRWFLTPRYGLWSGLVLAWAPHFVCLFRDRLVIPHPTPLPQKINNFFTGPMVCINTHSWSWGQDNTWGYYIRATFFFFQLTPLRLIIFASSFLITDDVIMWSVVVTVVMSNYWIFARTIMTTQFTMAKFCVGPEEEDEERRTRRGGEGLFLQWNEGPNMRRWWLSGMGPLEYAPSCLSPSIKNWISFLK